MVALNLTTLGFSKFLALSVGNLMLGLTDYTGLALFFLSQVIYHTGEYFFVLKSHLYDLNWNSKKIPYSLS
jgi:hypothetical protein